MSAIKRAALDALAKALGDFMPDVQVRAVAESYEKDQVHPSVQLMPRRFVFTAFNDEEVDTSIADRNLVTVGEFAGQVEVRVGTVSKHEREEIQDLVWHALNQDEYRVGVLLTTTDPVKVGGTQFLHRALIAAVLPDSDGTVEWRDEMVFDASRYSYITLDVSYPALVNRQAYDMNALSVAFTEDLDSDNPALDEERQVTADE